MNLRKRTAGLALALSSVVCISLAGTAHGEAAGASPARPTPFFVRYFDEPRPLQLDAGAIAVRPRQFDAQAEGGWTPELAARLGARSVVASEGEVVAVGGFVRGRLDQAMPNMLAGEIATRNAVAQLANDNELTFASPVFIDERGMPMVITEEILVGLRDDADPANAVAAFEDAGLAVVEANFAGLSGVYLLRSNSRNGFEVLEQANALGERAEVLFSEPNAIIRGENFLIPNDPLFNQQWALNQGNNIDMDGPQAWDISTGDNSIITVILDVGMQFNHPDLNNAPGQDFSGSVPNGGPANACDNHGTAVAGCISAIINNNYGIAGGAPGTRTASGKIGTSTSWFGICFGTFDSQPAMLANALNWSVTSGARITNSSFGYGASATVTNAYASSRNQGVLHFAASGNGGNNSISYPANLPTVNAIGALQSNGQMASFSQFGVGQQFVAPGANILTTDRTGGDGYENGDFTFIDGTSFASPYAASVAALILSINPDLTVTEVEQMMQQTAVDMGPAGYDTTFGWGRVNLFNAAQAAQASVGEPLSCGDPNAGDCCTENGTPFCNDAACCEAVCANDPFCCGTEWDDLCVEAASELCPACFSCGNPAAGSCCEDNGTPYCDDALCCNAICGADPFCCETEWDQICADQANESANCASCLPPTGACCFPGFNCAVVTAVQCTAAGGEYQGNDTTCDDCPSPTLECGSEDAGSCCEANGTPFCNDGACCELICADDPFCCETEWDQICANQAIDRCADCFACGSAEAGDCCENNGTPFCNDAACCETVCAEDPFCCETSWDNLCAQAAGELCGDLCGVQCSGDINGDGIVNAADLSILLNEFGCTGTGCTADLNDDDIVNAADLSILLNNFGCGG